MQTELEAIFEKQYSLTTRAETEIRYRTETRTGTTTSTDPVTGETTTEEYTYGYTYLEIARMEGSNKSTVMRSAKTALKKIQEKLAA